MKIHKLSNGQIKDKIARAINSGDSSSKYVNRLQAELNSRTNGQDRLFKIGKVYRKA